MTTTNTAPDTLTAEREPLPGQDGPDMCDCCQGRPGRTLIGGDWLCDPCESYMGTRLARSL